jgi:hypothetical protein
MWNPCETIWEPLGNLLESIRKGTEAIHWNPYGNYSVAMSVIHYNLYKNYREPFQIHMEVYMKSTRLHVKINGKLSESIWKFIGICEDSNVIHIGNPS